MEILSSHDVHAWHRWIFSTRTGTASEEMEYCNAAGAAVVLSEVVRVKKLCKSLMWIPLTAIKANTYHGRDRSLGMESDNVDDEESDYENAFSSRGYWRVNRFPKGRFALISNVYVINYSRRLTLTSNKRWQQLSRGSSSVETPSATAAMSRSKYTHYAVRVGRVTGIYRTRGKSVVQGVELLSPEFYSKIGGGSSGGHAYQIPDFSTQFASSCSHGASGQNLKGKKAVETEAEPKLRRGERGGLIIEEEMELYLLRVCAKLYFGSPKFQSSNEDYARDDAAYTLLEILLRRTGYSICDYNYRLKGDWFRICLAPLLLRKGHLIPRGSWHHRLSRLPVLPIKRQIRVFVNTIHKSLGQYMKGGRELPTIVEDEVSGVENQVGGFLREIKEEFKANHELVVSKLCDNATEMSTLKTILGKQGNILEILANRVAILEGTKKRASK
ncbi:hypothetical protein PIB30_013810 [Stylosanthes scabra]|uniref:Uncharacterized protein n=1 Tax=Stylosanthes scabra TaxID=79078 RepID=A0ABU6R5I9_9FABA|nr:hypothetical protein [Stylosanthes scabra]